MWYADLRKNTRLGTLLVRRRLITTAQLHAAISLQRRHRNANLGDILVEQGWVTHHDIRRSLRRQARVRYVATLVAMLWAPLQPVSAGDFLSASANAENVAFADAETYADAPQLKLHDPGARGASINTSLSRAAQLTAKRMLQSWWRSYRAAAGQESSPRPYSSKQTLTQNYSLRLSEDDVLVRAKFRF
ncbi:MAG: hypothetical protein OET44_00910 [Gammaproteobacteria bacterium]|nr:hypothetical protein [Gammaproteobacteria bacterium]